MPVYRSASKTPLGWRFACGPIVTRYYMLTGFACGPIVTRYYMLTGTHDIGMIKRSQALNIVTLHKVVARSNINIYIFIRDCSGAATGLRVILHCLFD